jgi:hypothetical protein
MLVENVLRAPPRMAAIRHDLRQRATCFGQHRVPRISWKCRSVMPAAVYVSSRLLNARPVLVVKITAARRGAASSVGLKALVQAPAQAERHVQVVGPSLSRGVIVLPSLGMQLA